MSNYILYPVLELKGYIFSTVALLFVLTMAVVFVMGKKGKNLEEFQWHRVFLGRTKTELLYMALGISQICYVFSAVFSFSSIGIVQIAALLILCAVRAALLRSPGGAAGEMFFCGMEGIGLLAGNLLADYMRETGMDTYIFLIWLLLSLFLMQYSLYYFMKSLERMLRRHGRTGKIQKKTE